MTQDHDRPLRRVIVPDLAGEPLHMLRVLEEVLLVLTAWEAEDAEAGQDTELAGPLAGGRALEAVNRLQDALVPSQDRTSAGGRLLAPVGCHRTGTGLVPEFYEHIPMTVVQVSVSDVAVLGALARELGQPIQNSEVAQAVDDMTEAHLTTRTELIQQTARLAGLLDLAWTDDADTLTPRLLECTPGRDVHLSSEEEAAYQRLADRLNTMATGDDAFRWFY